MCLFLFSYDVHKFLLNAHWLSYDYMFSFDGQLFLMILICCLIILFLFSYDVQLCSYDSHSLSYDFIHVFLWCSIISYDYHFCLMIIFFCMCNCFFMSLMFRHMIFLLSYDVHFFLIILKLWHVFFLWCSFSYDSHFVVLWFYLMKMISYFLWFYFSSYDFIPISLRCSITFLRLSCFVLWFELFSYDAQYGRETNKKSIENDDVFFFKKNVLMLFIDSLLIVFWIPKAIITYLRNQWNHMAINTNHKKSIKSIRQ